MNDAERKLTQMELVLPETTLMTGHEVFEEEFAIGNIAVILGILRGKMYSNPIKTIAQEISSNARDAHREVGKSHVPIEISLNKLERNKTFIVRDFGPGISPDRMANIFIKYGNSTKRDTNLQTGGFGLGAKSPFSYSDSFTIISITPEKTWTDKDGNIHNNCLVKRQYCAIIDPSQVGKLLLIHSEVTEEAQGTFIIVPIKDNNDADSFISFVTEITQYWDVKPNTVGFTCNYTKVKEKFKGNNWTILERDVNHYSGAGFNIPLAIVDGIPYKIQTSYLKGIKNHLAHLFGFPVRFFFSVGEIQLAANREDIDYQKETIERINAKFGEVYDSIVKQIEDKISSCKNLFEANSKWREIKYEFSNIVQSAKWHNIPLVGGDGIYLRDGGMIASYIRGNDDSDGNPTVSYKKKLSISFNDGVLFCINDTENKMPAKGRIVTLFSKNKNIKEIQVLCYNGDTLEDCNKIKDDLEKKFYISKLDPVMLSTVERTKVKAQFTGKYKICPIKEITNNYYNRFSKSTDIDLDEVEGVYCKYKNKNVFVGEKQLSDSDIDDVYNIVSKDGKKLYAINEGAISKLPDTAIPIEDYLKNKLKTKNQTYCNTNYNFYNQFSQLRYTICGTNSTDNKLINNKLSQFIDKLDKNSIAYDFIEKSINMPIDDTGMRVIERLIGEQTDNSNKIDMFKLYEGFNKKYPFLRDYYNTDKIPVDHIIDYINMCDKK